MIAIKICRFVALKAAGASDASGPKDIRCQTSVPTEGLMATSPQKAQTEVIAPRMQPGATLVAAPHLRLLPTAAALPCG